ncbi:Endo-type membrane-bound lytic murein transglycosylase A precursor [Serratia entomophila]|jgi:membrane-bound lytic murein transglycosylase E|uniref:peptidoglycan lytic exotransglycosylase n=1 Tax=Serratia entomophila TaxID=42906 RepID=A0ABY5CRI8_9GAMM|nr:transglycosylase SLT domain-containing protein [Serratia entomophila]UIW17786.1 transglycosylase SLT domain-containing protein [Serratia entomophila]USV00345.1 transglycosylase SLT domain-containing protein [Serratia entomophila]CAI0693376.1 Endo-type membrane-bound lytic murein transglycosylase A precursor [Serratia entomophila]CAI0764871.1 Endo-type membrane-bound lytic murein transglycosylase A precursor [Serratia entomophila]CAI0914515.1 Endo-type membrane-bound lytic murein transglycos
MKFSLSQWPRLGILCAMLVLAGCAGKKQRVSYDRHAYDSAIQDAADEYDVDAKLITAMINVESGFNPAAVSKSNAIGLMQLKADTAGCDAYRYKGKRGCPDDDDLLDPDTNIDLGAAYLAVLQKQQLKGIDNPVTLRYATIIAYVNGTGALLRTFSSNRQQAIAMINNLSPEAFNWHVRKYHPAPQAPRHLMKVETAYERL